MQNITIRNATLADAPRILEIYAYYVEHTVITFEYDTSPKTAPSSTSIWASHRQVPSTTAAISSGAGTT